MKNKLFALLVLGFFSILSAQLSTLFAQGTAFTYNGRLSDGGSPANGHYDLTFSLFDADSGPNQVAGTLTNSAIALSNGLFTATLDFGAGVFTGANRWLEMGVRSNGGGAFTTLGPRQQIMATPYAIYSANAGSAATANTATTAASANSVSGANITGTISDARLSANVALLTNPTNTFSGAVTASSFAGSGAGVTNVQLGTINSGGAITVGTFVLASSPDVGPGVNFVTAADVNGDGKIDMVVVNGGGSSFGAVTVLTNNGSGGFVMAATMNVAVGYYPTAVAVADVNSDGQMDLISGNNDAGTLTVLTNDGSGGWVSATTLGVGAHAASVAAADVNADGKVDLISANYLDSTLTVLTNNGSGAFAISSSPGVGSHPVKVEAANVNGDGKVDLISENLVDSTLTVLTNDGNGNFVLASTLNVGPNPQSLAAADVNGDGKVDLISASTLDNTLTVLTNNGGGGFAPATILAVGSHPLGVTAADVNGDGRLDLISANYDDSTLTVLLNNGSGSFVLASTLNVGAGPQSLVTADVNGDGKPDLLSANASDNTVSVLFNVFNVVTFNGSFTGNGANATNLNASNFTSGTISDARLSANVALLNGSANFSGAVMASSFTGNGTGLTNLNAVAKTGDTMTGTLNLPANGLVAGTTQLVLSGGNVGIGTDTPGAKLHVNGGSVSGMTTLEVNGQDTETGLIARFRRPPSGEAALTFGSVGADFAYIASERNIELRTSQSGQNTGTARLTVLNNGNVGIGKNNPATMLDVNGAVTATSFSGSGAGLINVSADAIAGGLTTNIAVLVAGGGTNTLCFTNGVLRAVQ